MKPALVYVNNYKLGDDTKLCCCVCQNKYCRI